MQEQRYRGTVICTPENLIGTFEGSIVNEVRKVRRKHAEQYAYDLDKIVAALQTRERDAKDIVQPQPPKPSTTTVRHEL